MTPKLTQQQAVDLINGSVGKCIDTDLAGVKDDYGCQCEALLSYYLTNLGYPSVMKMNAIDFYNLCVTTNPLKLQKVSSPQLGDILYINMSFGGKHFSHVSTVIKVDGANVVSVDQNWVNADLDHGSPAAIVVHPLSSVTAFFRPQFKEENMIFNTKQECIDYYWNTLHRTYPQQVSDAEINGLIGKDFSATCAQERTSDQWLHQNDLVINGDQRLQTINDLNQKIQALQSTPTQQEIQTLKDEVASLTSTINNLENKPQ